MQLNDIILILLFIQTYDNNIVVQISKRFELLYCYPLKHDDICKHKYI